jgi:hypothetical protein
MERWVSLLLGNPTERIDKGWNRSRDLSSFTPECDSEIGDG